eukprot:m.159680 g.159680  ORF g.159680 m.159680 type:complete len:60 (-) comp14535_c0_seq8:812-991(-)
MSRLPEHAPLLSLSWLALQAGRFLPVQKPHAWHDRGGGALQPKRLRLQAHAVLPTRAKE